MKLKSISLENFRQFKSLDLKLPESKFIVFVGPNGSGKSTLLDAISLALVHITGSLVSAVDNYYIENSVQVNDITNGDSNCKIEINLNFEGQPLTITTSKKIDKRGVSYNIQPERAFNKVKLSLKNDIPVELPILVYYRTNRIISLDENVSPKKKYFHNKQLEGYRIPLNKKYSPFLEFSSWYISQENLENEQKISTKDLEFQLENLKLIRKSIELFLNKIGQTFVFKNLRVNRSSDSNLQYENDQIDGELVINKGDEIIRLNQLSYGEKMIFFIVADISRRLCILNANQESSMHGVGFVLIDELELHLHPNWQRNLIVSLKAVFPNIQFLGSSHSPQILNHLNENDVLVLDNKKVYTTASSPLGRDSNSILEEILGGYERPKEIEDQISEIFEQIGKNEINFSLNEKFDKLKLQIASDDPVLLRIENLLLRKSIN
ncbi:MAG: AAA family ATPase [Saprospiraceae bacterium]|nr:AAA family ATPase [Candidatus Opimibacter iunctus]